MTDSTVPDRGGKRERLVASAGDLLHRQGVAATTLAQVAEAADVPAGNVYYYFKTKDDLVRAVIEDRAGGSARCWPRSSSDAGPPPASRRWRTSGWRCAT